MQSWLDFEYARAHCAQLRERAARDRLARIAAGPTSVRAWVARTLVAAGNRLVDAGDRVLADVRLAS